jgi:hypothetical protein
MNIVDQVNNINGNGCSLLGWPRVESDHMDASKVLSEQLSEEPEPIAFSNYDVLFTESPSSSKTKAKRDSDDGCFLTTDHAGNYRFLVLISLHRQRYLDAVERSDVAECESIALEIIHTVRFKCAPNGRFFYRDLKSNRWLKIDDDDTILVGFVQRAIKNVFLESKVERPPKRVRVSTSSFNLLRDRAEPVASTPNSFDVICNGDGTLKADAHHVGNARLQVILDMRVKTFMASKEQKQKESIAQDIVSAIVDDSSSRFLFEDKSGHFMHLSRKSAATGVMNALQDMCVDERKQSFRKSEIKKLAHRKFKKSVLSRLKLGLGQRQSILKDGVPTSFTALSDSGARCNRVSFTE